MRSACANGWLVGSLGPMRRLGVSSLSGMVMNLRDVKSRNMARNGAARLTHGPLLMDETLSPLDEAALAAIRCRHGRTHGPAFAPGAVGPPGRRHTDDTEVSHARDPFRDSPADRLRRP